MKTNPSIEDIANFFLDKYHPNYNLDINRDISQIRQSSCFTLKIFANDGNIFKMYLLCTAYKMIAETSDPFYEKNIQYFNNVQTKPDFNFWIGYIILDETLKCIDAQRFKIKPNSPLLKEIFF